ncbi:hypothetical protein HN011_001217 [Eciton burchellii]|nr:hypothetical protein HN011_001217 [Eciton burchellii]
MLLGDALRVVATRRETAGLSATVHAAPRYHHLAVVAIADEARTTLLAEIHPRALQVTTPGLTTTTAARCMEAARRTRALAYEGCEEKESCSEGGWFRGCS